MPTKLSRWITNSPTTRNDGPIRVAMENVNCKTPLRIKQDGRYNTDVPRYIIYAAGVVVGVGLSVAYIRSNRMEKKVLDKFKKGDKPDALRKDPYITRESLEKKITDAYFDRNDTGGMFGVVFGAAGTGKSNVLRHICADRFGKDGGSGALYVELGSDKRFAHVVAKACGIPLEPNVFEMMLSYLFPNLKNHLTLPSDCETTALATVFPIIMEAGKKYVQGHKDKHVPVLIIDGADIVAKNNEKLFHALLEWAKRCANEDSLLIVLGSSDGHVLRYLDKQSCKSRSGPFIEVIDFPVLDDDLKKLFKKHGVEEDDARYLFDEVTGGRLTDIYKAIQFHERLSKGKKPEEIKHEEIHHEISKAFENEIQQALNKAMDNPCDDLQLEIAKIAVSDTIQPLSVHDLAKKMVVDCKASSTTEAMKAVYKFVDNNVLRYNEKQQLVAHSVMARKVLQKLVRDKDTTCIHIQP